MDGIAQLDRVVSSSGGAALLCGHAGTGRKSALALVAYMHHMEVAYIPPAMLVTLCMYHIEFALACARSVVANWGGLVLPLG